MKILVADDISERALELLRAQSDWQLVDLGHQKMDAAARRQKVMDEVKDAEALIVRSATKANRELLENATRLRVIGRAGVGVDNVDLEAATHRGVVVMNTPGGNAASVAEHALALMLALARSVPQLNAAMHAGRWEKSGSAGCELRGKTLGLVGLGRVGAEVARRAHGFEMRVLAH